MSLRFPDTFDFTGFNAPSRVECDILDLEIEGEVPAEIDGCWYRLTPDPQYPPMLGDDTYLSGDGMISMFRFRDGHVDYRSRYIMTERLADERAARRSLHGLYRNPFTDDASVQGRGRGAANTTPVWHGGRLLCLKEDSRAMEVHPETLETIGEWDYDGRLRSETMTAHPRLDPETGELYFFGYEAGGLCTHDVAYCVANRDGDLVREDWFQVPYVALMHDFVVTKEHAIFPVFPTTTDLERLKAGGAHWVWESDRESFVGIMPRDGRVEDMRWFRGPACMSFHFMNAHTDGHLVHMDFGVSNVNVFPFIQKASGIDVPPHMARSALVRWTFDLSKPGDAWEETPLGPPGDMPRVALKDHMIDYGVAYYERFDPANGPPLIAGPVGAGFNTVSRIEIGSGRLRDYSQPGATFQEAIHIPSNLSGHEGWLAFVADLHERSLSEVILLEAAKPDSGAVARIRMPLRLRNQVHGNWVPAEQM
jgi:carotenoid cleavage dioxygenase-like enzyme